MSERHYILDAIHPLSQQPDETLDAAIDKLVMEHVRSSFSIEDRADRAEALALLAIEMIRRMAGAQATGGKGDE